MTCNVDGRASFPGFGFPLTKYTHRLWCCLRLPKPVTFTLFYFLQIELQGNSTPTMLLVIAYFARTIFSLEENIFLCRNPGIPFQSRISIFYMDLIFSVFLVLYSNTSCLNHFAHRDLIFISSTPFTVSHQCIILKGNVR